MWLPEAWGREAFTNAGLMLRATSSMIVATGIANIWARDAVAASNAAKTLNAAYDDRFVLGLGVSHRPLVERLRGHEYASPVEAMREYLTAMDAAPMLAPEGERALRAGHRGARPEDARGRCHARRRRPSVSRDARAHRARRAPPSVTSSSASNRPSCSVRPARSS